MRSVLIIAAVFAACPVRAEPKDIADLFPADSLFYVEAHQVGAVAKELAAFLKGTHFDHQSLSLDRLRQMQKKNESIDSAAASMITYCLSAGMLKEAERFAGFAFALTGLDKNGDPEFIAVLRTGESQVPGYFMRAFIAADISLQSETSVEGIRLYQQRGVQFERSSDGDGTELAKTVYSGPCYAYQPGIVLFGSSKQMVAATVRRLKEKETAPSLVSNNTFKALIERRSLPGILFYADTKSLFSRLETAQKQGRGFDPATWYVLKRLLPPKSLRTLTGKLDINEQGIGLFCSLELEQKNPGLLANLVDGQSLTVADLNVFVKDVPFAATLRLPSGDNRIQKFLSAIDSFMISTGGLGPTASEIARELEEQKIVSRSILQKIDRMTLALPSTSNWGKSGFPIPSILIHGDSAETTDALAAAFPKILEIFGGSKGDAVTERIDGVRISTLESKASPLGKPILFGRYDNTLGVGVDRKSLAACLAATVGGSTAADSNIGAAFKAADRSSVVGVWKWSEAAKALATQKTPGRSSNRRSYMCELGDGSFAMSRARTDIDLISLARSLLDDLQELPPMVGGLSRSGNELRLVLNQRDPKRARVKVIKHWLDWYSRASSGRGAPEGGFWEQNIDIMIPQGGFFPQLLTPPPVPGGKE